MIRVDIRRELPCPVGNTEPQWKMNGMIRFNMQKDSARLGIIRFRIEMYDAPASQSNGSAPIRIKVHSKSVTVAAPHERWELCHAPHLTCRACAVVCRRFDAAQRNRRKHRSGLCILTREQLIVHSSFKLFTVDRLPADAKQVCG